MLYVNQAVGQFRERFALIPAAKGGHLEHCVQMFKMVMLFSANRF